MLMNWASSYRSSLARGLMALNFWEIDRWGSKVLCLPGMCGSTPNPGENFMPYYKLFVLHILVFTPCDRNSPVMYHVHTSSTYSGSKRRGMSTNSLESSKMPAICTTSSRSPSQNTWDRLCGYGLRKIVLMASPIVHIHTHIPCRHAPPGRRNRAFAAPTPTSHPSQPCMYWCSCARNSRRQPPCAACRQSVFRTRTHPPSLPAAPAAALDAPPPDDCRWCRARRRRRGASEPSFTSRARVQGGVARPSRSRSGTSQNRPRMGMCTSGRRCRGRFCRSSPCCLVPPSALIRLGSSTFLNSVK